ncbi:MAG: hypothetical protein DWG76_05670 [Chloroflexi bacterium]|nr:hypothetical protein [Chloroflexota bacterium]
MKNGMPPTLRRLGLPLALYLLTAILLTWPTITQVASALPMGSERSATVPQLNVWTLQWTRQSAAGGFESYWDAPIFYPSQGALAFSDPQPLAGLLSLPFGGVNPVAAYNAVWLLYITLNGLAAFGFFRHLKLALPIALLGGFWAQALPFLTHERSVLQLQPLFVLVLALWAAQRLLATPSLGRALLLGLTLGGSFYLSEYFGLIAAMLVGLHLVMAMRKSRWTGGMLLLGIALALLISFPYLLRQAQILDQYGFTRASSSVRAGSATLADFLSPSPRTYLAQLLGSRATRFGLYPSLTLVVLALFSLARKPDNPHSKYARPVLAWSAGIAFLLSLGLNLTFLGFRPYEWLWQSAPGFSHIRSPFRFGLLMQFALLMLALLTLGRLWRRKQILLLCVLALVTTFEIFPLPETLVSTPTAGRLTRAESPAVFLPFVSGRSAAAYYQTTNWMLLAQRSGITIINGYSGYFPTSHLRFKDALQGFPDEKSLQLLEMEHIRTLILPTDWLDADGEVQLSDWVAEGRLIPLGTELTFSLFGLP